jgi:AAA ATPase domain
VILTGVGGIGKTAVAGRVLARLRDDGWLVTVHEGRWNPTALIGATAQALHDGLPGVVDPGKAEVLRAVLARLTDPSTDDGPKLAAVAFLVRTQRLLVAFDDFEQNLSPGGETFLDPAIGDMLTALADAAQTGALLLTCRYPLPPAPPTRPAWTSVPGWPPPTPPTRNGSATCPSATTSWGMWRPRPGT